MSDARRRHHEADDGHARHPPASAAGLIQTRPDAALANRASGTFSIVQRSSAADLVAMQGAAGNRAVARFRTGARTPTGETLPPEGNAGAARGQPSVQRMVAVLEIDKNGLIKGSLDHHRPPGNIRAHDGDHTTPFISLQQEVVNALAGATVADAWANLEATYAVYTTLPGWKRSRASVQQGVAELDGYWRDVPALLASRGDLNALLSTANAMLALRNQVELSAMPGKQAKGVGNAEATHSGGLHHYEAIARSGKAMSSHRADVLYNMSLLFDHGRNDGRRDAALAEATWKQHCITMVSAYPLLAAACTIGPGDIHSMRGSASKLWHEKYAA